MDDLNLFKEFSQKEIEVKLQKLAPSEMLKSAIDCIKNSKDFLEASKILSSMRLYKPAQILSGIAIEELAKCKALLDFIEKKKAAKEVARFFFNHTLKYLEIYHQEKYSRQRNVVRKQGAYVSFNTINKRPLMYANEGFEGLATHEAEDAQNGIITLENRIKIKRYNA